MTHDRDLDLGNVALLGGGALLAFLITRRVFARDCGTAQPRNGHAFPVLGSFDAGIAIQLFEDAATGARRNARAARAARLAPAYRQRTLVDEACRYRAWMFWTGAPPETATVGDAWAHIEKPSGEITAMKRFRTTDEARLYVKAALKRALERAGKFDCY